MIISHTHRFIFIKSTKTAGTSVEAALSNFCSGDDIVTPLGDYYFNRDEKGTWTHKSMNAGVFQQHDDAITIKNRLPTDIWNNYFKFSITRNPWDRTLSRFFWNHRNDPALKPKEGVFAYLGLRKDELKPIRNAFKRFLVEEEWDTNDRFYIIDGELCVDYVIRYENLEGGLREACIRVGLPEIHLPRLKSGFRDKKRHYSEYYDNESRDLVAEKHHNDIRIFGYQFEST